MIQSFQNQNRQVQYPARQMNQVQSYQDNTHNQMMMNPFGNDPFFNDFQQMHSSMMQNFQNMTQMMLRGIPHQGFSTSLMSQDFNEDDIFGFSKLHNQALSNGSSMNNGGGQFQVFSRSMVQKQVVGPDGQPKIEKYYNDNTILRGEDGNTVSERKQAYHNQGSGRSIVAQEKMLNDQGHKYIKERNHLGEIQDQNLYHNIQEDEAQDFHNRWTNQRNAMKSIASNEPARYMQIQHDPQRHYQQIERPQISYQQPSSDLRQPLSYQYERPKYLQQQQQPITPTLSQSSNSRPLSGYSQISNHNPSRYPPTYAQSQRIQTPLSESQGLRQVQNRIPQNYGYSSYNRQ